ncbi:MAG: flagellar protein export ATPase FliI, partial [Rhodoferax sp.]|nr:flagellar protein export ATPase FliI [Rhodoferax sp.]
MNVSPSLGASRPSGGVDLASAASVDTEWTRFMEEALQRTQGGTPLEARGTLTRLAGLVLEAAGIRVPVGSQCKVAMAGQAPVLVEVVGFSNDRAYLMPAGDVHGLV